MSGIMRYLPDPLGPEVPVGKPSPLPVQFYPNVNDAFGRMRVSNPTTLFDSKQIHDKLPLFYDDQETSGTGTSSVYSKPIAATTMGVSAATAGTRVRQTFQRFNYQPGKSLLVLITGVLLKTGGGAGVAASMGYYDENNGIFLRSRNGTSEFVIRTSSSGTPVDAEVVPQSEWNGDPLDGTGISGHTLDLTQTQILWVDFEWLGVGSVRCGFVINGEFILCHTFHHANNINVVYMSTPNLPVRYEISNDGTGPASTMDHICSTIISEGGSQPAGTLRYASTAGTHIDASTANEVYAVFGIRLKSNALDETITFESVSMVNQASGDFEWSLRFNPTVAGTLTYDDLDNSSVQVAIGATENTVTGGTSLDGGIVRSTNQGGGVIGILENALRIGSAIDGTPDEMVLCVRPLSANADIEASLTWREVY